MQATQMIQTHPDVQGNMNEALVRCIEECYSCAQTCTSCADACLAEGMVEQLRQCIRLNLDCADVCIAAGNLPLVVPVRMRKCYALCLKPVPWPAGSARRSAKATQGITSTAGFVPKAAAGASRPARKPFAVSLLNQTSFRSLASLCI